MIRSYPPNVYLLERLKSDRVWRRRGKNQTCSLAQWLFLLPIIIRILVRWHPGPFLTTQSMLYSSSGRGKELSEMQDIQMAKKSCPGLSEELMLTRLTILGKPVWDKVILLINPRKTHDLQTQHRCAICGSRFAERKCYYCDSKVCTSCVVSPEVSGSTTKCLTCDRRKINRLSFAQLIRRNYYLFAIIISYWLFTVFPIPFMQLFGLEINSTAFQPVLIATAVMTIPFVFMFIAWQRRAPRGYS